MSKWVLKFISGKYQGSEFPLKESEDYTVGRSQDSSLVLVEDMVSRNHARLYVQDNLPYLEDLKSTNGSFVNGERVSHVQLKEGDRILFGTSIIKLVRAGEDAQAAIAQEPARPDPIPGAAMGVSGGRTIAMVAPALTPPPSAQNANSTTPPEDEPRAPEARPPEARQPSGARPTIGGISGLLEEVSLADLLQLFSASRKSGVLRLESGVQRANFFLREGRCVFAEILGSEHLAAEKAAYRIMTWTTGTFVLEPPEEREFPEEIEMTTEGMMMESMRLLDEMENIRDGLPDADKRLSLASPLSPPLRALTPELLDTLQLVLNHSVVQLVLDHSLGSDLETVQDVIYLLRHNYIVAED